MKILKKIIVTVVSIFLLLLLTYNVYNFISTKVLKNDIAPVFGYAVLEVVSGSMEPTIHVGDMIIIDMNDTTYDKDDIITFYDKEGGTNDKETEGPENHREIEGGVSPGGLYAGI